MSIESLNIRPGDKFVLITRVSERVQKRRGNLADQEANLKAIVAQGQGVVVDTWRRVGAGRDAYLELGGAADLAREHGAILLAESTDRFVRHPDYHSKLRPDLQAGPDELAELFRYTKGVRLMTVLDPNADPGTVRSYQTERGQKKKQKKGGRPKKTRPAKYKKPAQQDQLAMAKTKWGSVVGRSLSDIAEITGRSKSTIQGWRDNMDADGTLRPAKIQTGGEIPPELSLE